MASETHIMGTLSVVGIVSFSAKTNIKVLADNVDKIGEGQPRPPSSLSVDVFVRVSLCLCRVHSVQERPVRQVVGVRSHAPQR